MKHRFEMARSDVRWWLKLLSEATPDTLEQVVKRVTYAMATAVASPRTSQAGEKP